MAGVWLSQPGGDDFMLHEKLPLIPRSGGRLLMIVATWGEIGDYHQQRSKSYTQKNLSNAREVGNARLSWRDVLGLAFAISLHGDPASWS